MKKGILIITTKQNNEMMSIINYLIKQDERFCDYKKTIVNNGQQALECLKTYANVYKVILLYPVLPDINGFELCEKIKNNHKIPIVMMSPFTSDKNELKAFDVGVDDYIKIQQTNKKVIMSRINRLLPQISPIVTFEGICIDNYSRNITIDGDTIYLSFMEYELLLYLMSHYGRAYSRETLLHELWDEDTNSELRTIDTHIKKIRRKIGKYRDYIQTVHSIGYKFEKPN